MRKLMIGRKQHRLSCQPLQAAMSGQKMATPEDQAQAEAGKAAGFKAAALTAGAGFATAPLAAASAGTASAGTGILGPGGEELTKDVTTFGPSLARSGVNAVINLVKAHPIISTYVGTHLANALGIPLPKVLKALAGIQEVAP